ncbi:hypothetical protein [Listeria newyorkensis]|nr:hypothetical protein [Listeria newyorkensis]
MIETKQTTTLYLGNTLFNVTSRFEGVMELSHIIKRIIQKEIEQECC